MINEALLMNYPHGHTVEVEGAHFKEIEGLIKHGAFEVVLKQEILDDANALG